MVMRVAVPTLLLAVLAAFAVLAAKGRSEGLRPGLISAGGMRAFAKLSEAMRIGAAEITEHIDEFVTSIQRQNLSLDDLAKLKTDLTQALPVKPSNPAAATKWNQGMATLNAKYNDLVAAARPAVPRPVARPPPASATPSVDEFLKANPTPKLAQLGTGSLDDLKSILTAKAKANGKPVEFAPDDMQNLWNAVKAGESGPAKTALENFYRSFGLAKTGQPAAKGFKAWFKKYKGWIVSGAGAGLLAFLTMIPDIKRAIEADANEGGGGGGDEGGGGGGGADECKEGDIGCSISNWAKDPAAMIPLVFFVVACCGVSCCCIVLLFIMMKKKK